FFDYAGVGPYTSINMNPAPSSTATTRNEPYRAYKDGVFISTHKFLGGPGASGVLVARLEIFSWIEKKLGQMIIESKAKKVGKEDGRSSNSKNDKDFWGQSILTRDAPTAPGGGTVDYVTEN